MTKAMMKKIENAKNTLANKKMYLEKAEANYEIAVKNNDSFSIGAIELQIQLLKVDIRELENLINETK